MSKSHKSSIPNYNPNPPAKRLPTKSSFLDLMQDGKEYQSIVGLQNVTVDLGTEMTRAMKDIADARKRPNICYIANVLNPMVSNATSISIDNGDDTPFLEMLKCIPPDERDIDIILVTPGGSADTVDYLVKKLRNRFDHVSFILPYMAMSAGTIFCMSGDELIMSDAGFFGPIDPQVPSKNGMFVPAQSLMTLISTIQSRGQAQISKGQKPDWTDIQILNNLDPKELGNAITASKLSTTLVTNYLKTYKFKTWETHSNGTIVTEEEKNERAMEIATQLCDNSIWLSHASRITRDMANDICKLRVTYSEDVEGLDRAIKRFWALMQITLENNLIAKIYSTGNYFLFRSVNIKK